MRLYTSFTFLKIFQSQKYNKLWTINILLSKYKIKRDVVRITLFGKYDFDTKIDKWWDYYYVAECCNDDNTKVLAGNKYDFICYFNCSFGDVFSIKNIVDILKFLETYRNTNGKIIILDDLPLNKNDIIEFRVYDNIVDMCSKNLEIDKFWILEKISHENLQDYLFLNLCKNITMNLNMNHLYHSHRELFKNFLTDDGVRIQKYAIGSVEFYMYRIINYLALNISTYIVITILQENFNIKKIEWENSNAFLFESKSQQGGYKQKKEKYSFKIKQYN